MEVMVGFLIYLTAIALCFQALAIFCYRKKEALVCGIVAQCGALAIVYAIVTELL